MVIDMPASFPSSVKTWANKQDNIDDVFAGDINGTYHEIIAIENELMQVGYKPSARVATTQNGDLATAFANGQTVDGIVLSTGDRILIKDQTSGAENGIYIVNASGAPSRAIDANTAAHMVPGLMVYVREGAVNGKGTWKLTTTGTITLGTTPLTFENELASHKADIAKVYISVTNPPAPLVAAIGDGVTDDKAAIQAVIDYVAGLGGGTVFFPKGIYKISGYLLAKENVSLVGVNRFCSKIKAVADHDIIRIYNTAHITIIGIEVEGWANEPDFTGFPGVQNGISVERSHDIHIEECGMSYCSGSGIIVTGKDGSGTYGPNDVYNVWVTKNQISRCDINVVFFAGAHKCFFTHNIVEYSFRNGLYVDDRSVSDTEAHMPWAVDVSNNIFYRNGLDTSSLWATIAVPGSYGVNVSENLIFESGQETYNGSDPATTTPAIGIVVQSGQSMNIGKYCKIVDNIIFRVSRAGISLQGVDYIDVHGNMIVDCGYNRIAGANTAIDLTSTTLEDLSSKGCEYNNIYNNTVIRVDVNSDIDYGARISADSNNNLFHNNHFYGITSSVFADSGTGNIKIMNFHNNALIDGDGGATTTIKGLVKMAVYQADSTATDVTGLKADFNALLAKLKNAGIMANS
jgi:hypothetical protein